MRDELSSVYTQSMNASVPTESVISGATNGSSLLDEGLTVSKWYM